MKYLPAFIILWLLHLACQENRSVGLSDRIAGHLIGQWKSEAWTGQLHETWSMGADNWLTQKAFYFEGSDTSYRANSKIEQVDEDLILFSVIKDSNPKIFKATLIQPDSIVFENSDYKNPFKVVYYFDDKDNYRRTITGVENDSLVRYTFNFERVMDK